MARSAQTKASRSPHGSDASAAARPRRKAEGTADRSDVLVSAVISTYLLTHLHHVLQRAEFGAVQEGHAALAANYAQLRKVLCLEARSLDDAAASGSEDAEQPNAA